MANKQLNKAVEELKKSRKLAFKQINDNPFLLTYSSHTASSKNFHKLLISARFAKDVSQVVQAFYNAK